MIRIVFALIVLHMYSVLLSQEATQEISQLENLLKQGMQARRDSEIEKARGLYDKAIKLSISQEDAEGLSDAVIAKANLFLFLKQTDSLIAIFDFGAKEEQQWGNKQLEVELLMFKAQSLKLMGQRDIAFEELQRLIPYSKSVPRQQSIALQEYSALQYQIYGNVDSAKYYIEKALRISREINDSLRLSSVLEARGNLQSRLGEYYSAIASYIEAINYVLQKNIYKKYLLLKGVGLIFKEIGQLAKAEDYTNQALSLAIEKKYSRATAVTQNQLGTIEQESGNIEKALEYYRIAEAYFLSKNNYNDILDVTCNMASLELQNNKFELAENYLTTVESNIDLADQTLQCTFWRLKGQVYLDQNKPYTALEHLQHTLRIASAIENIPEEIQILDLLKKAYAMTGNYKMAFEAGEEHLHLQDSVVQLRQSQLLFDTEARYQKAEQDKAISALNAENEIKDLRILQSDRQRLVLIAGLLSLGVISILIYRTARIKASNNAILKEKNAAIAKALTEKETLLKEIHHRVKNNLQVVSSLLTLQSHHLEDESVKQAIQEGQNRVASMGLIHQNLYQEDNLKGIDMQEYFKKLINNLFHSYNISPEKVILTSKVDRLNLDVDTVIPLALILNELITNALKYAFKERDQGHLNVELSQQGEQLHLLVQDDGIGFTEDIKPQERESFGYELIGMFAEKLEADIEILNGKGAGILLKISNYKMAE
jgi:two-component sensor histidine kinase